MVSDVQIIPAILAASEEEYRQKLGHIESSGAFASSWVHIDFMDNKFVPNQSVGMEVVASYPTDLKKEAHLMVVDPQNWVEGLKKAGFGRVIFHLGAADPELVITQIKDAGLEAGMALNPDLPVAKLTPFLGRIDLGLIMGVNPGFGGQEFIPQTVEKVRQAAQLFKQADVLVEVDGGAGEHVGELVEAGADHLVIGSYLIDGDIKQNLKQIWQNARG